MDQNADNVVFNNSAGFDCSFSIQWSGGQTGRTGMTALGQTVTMQMSDGPKPPSGTSCWARAYVQGGPNHDSGRNFNYVPNAGTVQYTISGGTLTPSFD
jgi:hypothetical protein